MSNKSKKNKDEEIEYESEEDSEEFYNKLKKAKEKLKACEKERGEYLAGWQRTKADLINYKKEQEKRITDYYKFANEGLILELLFVLDSFEEAIKHDKNEGIKQLYNQIKGILKSNGVEEIEAKGKKFNPEFHEAVSEADPEQSRRIGEGKIVEEIRKGYKLNGKMIRPSKVKVSK